MNSAIKQCKTAKGIPAILYKGIKFGKDSHTVKGDITWKCLKKNCTFTIKTSSDTSVIHSLTGQHSHETVSYTENDAAPSLEQENEHLKARIKVLEEQWNAAINRSMDLDIRLMELSSCESRMNDKTENVDNFTHVNSLIDRLSQFLRTELLSDADIDCFCSYLIDSFPGNYVVLPAVTAMIINDAEADLSFLRNNVKENNFTAFVINDGRQEEANDGWCGSHWSVVVYDSLHCKFYILDSMNKCNERFSMSLIRRVSSILTYKKIITLPCPQQTNNYDCGVFAMYFLEEVFKYRKMCSSTCLEDGLSLKVS
ncbi:uncharacterized protein LOC120353148 [Nilaparvata lugens]|uniref:uncharacterized protein LOC120353148 n=1 Tax=Nilaparvata lugens TaxID=108931 RepID=UPI00193E17C8|nr:uncharacterized protein LOC120353148 [Nilaparvata lugens]